MNIGKHSEEAIKIKELEDVIKRKDKEIKDIKTECAEQFKKIKDICFSNEYNGFNDKNAKLRKIYEIASDNFSELVLDMVIDNTKEKGKIIELSSTSKMK